MYSIIKNVQIIVYLLKAHGIKHLVLSPGARNVPFVHSVEQDSDFKCHSVVDERSAAYYALGLAAELDEPIAVSCTSSTACSNYMPAVKEAYEQGIPLVVLTADRDPRFREQMENQMILQPNMFWPYCRKSVNLSDVKDDWDFRYSERLVNDALLEMNHHGCGPVQINFPVFYGFKDFSVRKLPDCRIFQRIEKQDNEKWNRCVEELKNYRKILLLFGEGEVKTKQYEKLVERMFRTFNCAISVEHMSNLHGEGTIRTFVITEAASALDIESVLPDLLITFGGNWASDFKAKLRNYCRNFRHWLVCEDGVVIDTVMALEKVFECPDEVFFEEILKRVEDKSQNDLTYLRLWQKKINGIVRNDLQFSNFNAIGTLLRSIPDGSLLHLSILNSIRLSQFFDVKKSVQVYANVGAYGIDGSLSTFLGQASVHNGLSFLIVGDLSFLYDISASAIAEVLGANVRIMVINNQGGGEFHYVHHDSGFQNLNLHIAAGHHTVMEHWCKALPLQYLCARNQEELAVCMRQMVAADAKIPIILEVLTDIKDDSNILNEFYALNRHGSKKSLSRRIIGRLLRRLGFR